MNCILFISDCLLKALYDLQTTLVVNLSKTLQYQESRERVQVSFQGIGIYSLYLFLFFNNVLKPSADKNAIDLFAF